nr:hypothetical protein [Martellivirales sp.]
MTCETSLRLRSQPVNLTSAMMVPMLSQLGNSPRQSPVPPRVKVRAVLGIASSVCALRLELTCPLGLLAYATFRSMSCVPSDRMGVSSRFITSITMMTTRETTCWQWIVLSTPPGSLFHRQGRF